MNRVEWLWLAGGLASAIAPFVIVNIMVWKKKDKPCDIKVAHTIATIIVFSLLTGAIVGIAVFCR